MYETRDSFTRHLPEQFQGQAVSPVKVADGREVILLAGEEDHGCARAGSMRQAGNSRSSRDMRDRP